MKTQNYLLLSAFTIAIAFHACKTSEKSIDADNVKTTNKTISNKDTLPNNDKTVIKGKNDLDTIKGITTKSGIVKDTIETENISLINPKIHPITASANVDMNMVEKNYPEPHHKITKLSNFNPFLESMYLGAKWERFESENLNCFLANYKGADFASGHVNSFVYYFYDMGQITHADLIKTVTFWMLIPEYPKIEIFTSELYDQKDLDEYTHYNYYYTIGEINGEKLEVYTIIWNDQIYKFRALKNKVEIKESGFFI